MRRQQYSASEIKPLARGQATSASDNVSATVLRYRGHCERPGNSAPIGQNRSTPTAKFTDRHRPNTAHHRTMIRRWKRVARVAMAIATTTFEAPDGIRPAGQDQDYSHSGSGLALQQQLRISPVPVGDRIGTHISERLDGERRVEATHRRECRTPDHEQIGHVPTLAVAVDH